MINNKLKIGDKSENGQITIIDEDRLCYIVKSNSKGAIGLRTISKSLLKEFYSLLIQQPDITANEARNELSGKSEIDKFEYGYASTLMQMAHMMLTGSHSTDSSLIYRNPHSSRQVIYYGAPGTGKSHKIKEILAGQNVKKGNIFRTTFHPDSDYSTFVGAYKPTRGKKPLYGLNGSTTVRMQEGDNPLNEETITYNFIPQAFLNAYIRSYQTTDNVYLVVP